MEGSDICTTEFHAGGRGQSATRAKLAPGRKTFGGEWEKATPSFVIGVTAVVLLVANSLGQSYLT